MGVAHEGDMGVGRVLSQCLQDGEGEQGVTDGSRANDQYMHIGLRLYRFGSFFCRQCRGSGPPNLKRTPLILDEDESGHRPFAPLLHWALPVR